MCRRSKSTPARAFVVACACALLVTLIPMPLIAQQAPPSADTWVTSYTAGGTSYANSNFGSATLLQVAPNARSYVRFNLSGIPAGANVSRAMLRLYVSSVAAAGEFDVHQIDQPWGEDTLTFNSQPGPSGLSATGSRPIAVSSASINSFVLVDITSLVQGWSSGAVPNNGVALVLTTATGSFSFDSKESQLTANGPELQLVLNTPGPAGDAGPTGLQGPIGRPGVQGPQGTVGGIGTQGPKGDIGPAGPGASLSGMQQFIAPEVPTPWTAPAGVTRVLVEMWGAGAGGGSIHGGGGGAYSRGVVVVTPGTTYTITVGAGGAAGGVFQSPGNGQNSTMGDGGTTLMFAGGGLGGGIGGLPDPSAAISRAGFRGAAFGASFCPGPAGDQTGRGGDLFQSGRPGYVLLTWGVDRNPVR